MGRCVSFQESTPVVEPPPAPPDPDPAALRAQANDMAVLLQEIRDRIARAEGKGPEPVPRTPALPDPTKVAIVDEERCIICGICESSCPEHAITIEQTATIDPALCSGCGTCVEACPLEVISLAER